MAYKITKEEFDLLISLLPDWVKDVPKGLFPTFYGTCSYEEDLKIKKKIDGIIERMKLC